jgi:putative DNA primase/helicase
VRQAVNAIEHPDERFTVARIAFIREGLFLHMELPSGRRIRYPYARIYAGERSKTFTFRDASGGRWEWYHVLKKGRGAFGGLVAENATQALCRDIFVEAMLRLEAAGYRPVAHLHDEFICEVPDGSGSLEEFRHIITTPPAWAPDFPIATKARIADRFIEIKEPKINGSTPAEISLHGDDEPGPEIDIDDADEPQPITQRDIDEINVGLVREGIEPLRFNAAPESTVPPPREEPAQVVTPVAMESDGPMSPPEANIPPPDFDDPPPRSGGNGPTGSNGYDAGEAPRGVPADRYVYKDARGMLYMRVIRTTGKTFPTQHWRDGKWVNGWPPTVIPYCLPELLAAPPTEPVWICEGEKDAENVAALGLFATTNPGGAKVWQPELAQWFKNKQLAYILEDNDEAGRTHTRKIQAALTGIVPTIVVVPFPELAEKADVSDWLGAGGNKKLLLARAEQARRRTQTTRAYITTNLSTVKPRAVRWVWPGHLARGGLELLAGTPEIGKSQIHCQYIACATTGRDWPNGMPGIIPCRVILLTAEDTIEDTLVPRLKAAGADLKLIEEFKAVRRNNHDEMFLLGEDLDTLEQMIGDFGNIGLVTIDPITAYMGHAKHFDSHRASDVRSQLSPLKRLAERTGVAFSAITHPPKNASPRALDHFIGSQAFIAAARVGHLCVAETEEGENGAKRETGRRFFTNPKINIETRQMTLVYRVDVVELDDLDPDTGERIRAPVVRWQGDSAISAEEALAAAKPAKSSKSKSPQEFLTDVLISGPALRNVMVERGAERDFSLDQLKRAKRALGLKAFKKKGLKAGPSYWAFPEHVPPETEEDNLAAFGHKAQTPAWRCGRRAARAARYEEE